MRNKPTAPGEMTPSLRFPAFQDDWVVKKIGELGWLTGGGTPDRSVSEYWQGEIPWISSSDIYEDDIHTILTTRFINEKSIAESATKIIPKGSVLFVSRVGIGKLAINDKDVCTSQDFTNFISEKIYNYFLGYFFVANKLALVSLGQGTSIKGFSKGDLEEFELSFPSESEQQKIADCLSSLADTINAQSQKLTALKTHKKALLQQLFPAEGETVPRLRFRPFWDAGEWEERQLSQLTTKISDGIHATPVYAENGEYAFINGNNLVNGKIVIDEKTKRVNLAEFNKHKNPLDANSILMSINGTIGNLALFQDEKVILGKSACFINVDRKLVTKLFIYYMLQTDRVIGAFNTELTGSTIKNLSLGTIKNIQLLVPALPEQQKIADCLSSLDDLIAAQSQKLAALKIHKKALMQQLFPTAGA